MSLKKSYILFMFRINMELCRASDVMSATAETIHSQENIAKLAKMLLKTQYSGFPVVKYDEETKTEVSYGLITRSVCCSFSQLNSRSYLSYRPTEYRRDVL